jgi:predicted aspartyl protease
MLKKWVILIGVFRQIIEIGDPAGTRFASMDAIVDTGATFTVVPASILNNLGVVPNRRVRFRLADGGLLERDVGETMVRVLDYQAIRLVAFGSDDAPALLGSDTLEGLLLTVDPVQERLVPTDGWMLSYTGNLNQNDSDRR